MTNNIAKKYIRLVSRRMPVGGARKKQFLADLQEDMIQYLQEHPNADQTLLQDHFGTPDDIAEYFIEQMPSHLIAHKFRFRNRVVVIAVATAILIAISWIGTVLYLVDDAESDIHGYIVEPTIDIEEREEDVP